MIKMIEQLKMMIIAMILMVVVVIVIVVMIMYGDSDQYSWAISIVRNGGNGSSIGRK